MSDVTFLVGVLFVGFLVSPATSAREVEVAPFAGIRLDSDLGSPQADPFRALELDESDVYGLTVAINETYHIADNLEEHKLTILDNRDCARRL